MACLTKRTRDPRVRERNFATTIGANELPLVLINIPTTGAATAAATTAEGTASRVAYQKWNGASLQEPSTGGSSESLAVGPVAQGGHLSDLQSTREQISQGYRTYVATELTIGTMMPLMSNHVCSWLHYIWTPSDCQRVTTILYHGPNERHYE